MNNDTHGENACAGVGITYDIEQVRAGAVIDAFQFHNLIPAEGLNHVTGVVLKGVPQVSSWFIGLFEGNYTPTPSDTAASFSGTAVECFSYLPATRAALVAGAVVGGTVDNTASRAEFTFTADKTIYGAFVTPSSAKGGLVGPLLSAGRFAAPKNVSTGDVLRVTASFTAASV